MIAPTAARSTGALPAGAAQLVVTWGAVDGEDSPVSARTGVRYNSSAEYGEDSPVSAGTGVRYSSSAEYGEDSPVSAGADGWELDVGGAA